MERVFSTRLDESVIDELTRLARKLGVPKKKLLEELIRERARAEAEQSNLDVWAETAGAWRRREKPETTVRKARGAFQSAMGRHQEQ